MGFLVVLWKRFGIPPSRVAGVVSLPYSYGLFDEIFPCVSSCAMETLRNSSLPRCRRRGPPILMAFSTKFSLAFLLVLWKRFGIPPSRAAGVVALLFLWPFRPNFPWRFFLCYGNASEFLPPA